ncbi:hypothetical protein [Bacillus tuaregi]|uniref:hypothetical protein n=1 Tax=Bacillus tuaregi TaxID=1816695 RepID=UPI0008F924CF|nr:hypothetical protein [Bacillus tuaregi]
MEWVFGYFGLQILILAILIFGSWFIWDRRFKTKHGKDVPEGYIRTNEVSIDPTTKKKLVVYYHPETGKRFYKEED